MIFTEPASRPKSSWPEFYRDRMNDRYRAHIRTRYRVFIDLLRASIRFGDRVHEIGCGPGNITAALADVPAIEYRSNGLYASDICPEMLELARENIGEKALVYQRDALDPTPIEVRAPDVIHSHGLLEHFDDLDIRQMILIQKASGAHTLIHYVPGEKYETPSFGDERLLSTSDWKRICQPTDIVTFNDGFDYALIWRLR